jgi:hypothetical protein
MRAVDGEKNGWRRRLLLCRVDLKRIPLTPAPINHLATAFMDIADERDSVH